MTRPHYWPLAIETTRTIRRRARRSGALDAASVGLAALLLAAVALLIAGYQIDVLGAVHAAGL